MINNFKAYLNNRGVTEAEINYWNLGYCSNNDTVHGNKDFPVDLLNEYVSLYKFRNSVLIPLYSVHNEPVAIQSRRLNPTKDQAKFDFTKVLKRYHLYGLNKAYQSILDNGLAYIVEGPFDCIACHKYGYTNTVALMGTVLTEEHMCLLSRFARKVVTVLDNDKAGLEAVNGTIKGKFKNPGIIDKLKDYNIEVKSIWLDKDPDEILPINSKALII